MPGTIQVTVLEFKGASSSSKPSAKSLKVSMGKTQYQTWDKGDFSFPITKLREDLIVSLLDAGGNEIAHADIRTMQIIEKGSWDEVFSINEGGHVHMKLQFVLNEEERNRIRIMRESAVKKKLETNTNINLKLSETIRSEEMLTKNEHGVSDSQKGFVEIDVISPKVEASQAGSPSNSATSSALSNFTYQKEGGGILEKAIPVKELSVNTTDGSDGAPPSSPQVHESDDIRSAVEKGSSPKLSGSVIFALNTDPLQESQSQDPPQVHESVNIRSDIEKGSSSKLPGSVISQLKTDPIQKSHSQDPPQVHKSVNITSDVEKGSSSKLSGSVIYRLKTNPIQKSQSQDPPQVPESIDVGSNVEKDSSSKLPGSVISELKSNPIQISRTQNPPEKTPSNVRKMISAFENSQLQDVKTLKKSPSSPSHLNRYRKDGLFEDHEPKSFRKYKDHFVQAPKDLASREQTVKVLENSGADLTRQSTSETATSSGRMPEEQSQVAEANKLSSKLISSSQTSVAEGSAGGRGTGLESTKMTNVQVVSNAKRKSLECYKEECFSTQSSGMWIFPDNTRRLCITTAGKQVTNIVGNQRKEAKAHQVEKISSEPQVLEKNPMHGTKQKMEKNRKRAAKQPESGYGSPPDDSSHGLVGQVIKIAVILGFGALVLLTRQKEPRKKHREQNDNRFPIPDYIDERTMKPWPLQQ